MIVAVMMVRNEADIIRINLLYHLASGIDQVLVIDNGSTDQTAAILEEFADTRRVHVFPRPGAFHQAETTTEFAREAFLRGAQWVLPTDADEFWHTPGGRLRDILDDSAGAGALEVDVVNFVQDRFQVGLSSRGLLTMTRRVPEPIGTSGDAAELVESGRVSFVECRYPPKHISRGSIALQIAQGNHAVCGTDGPIRKTAAIVCLHAPLRSRAALEYQKVEQGRRVEEVNHYLQQAWHVRRWRRLSDEGGMDAEWAANSYLDNCLDVGGEKHPLTVDTTLADIVAPWIEGTSARGRTALQAKPEVQERAPIPELDSESRAAILNRVKDVEGWLRPEEAELLIDVTRRAVTEPGAGTVVEIGSFCGKSTIVLASAARTANVSARIHAIDPHEGEVGAEDTPDGVRTELPTLERFRRNVSAAGVTEVIETIRRRSYEVPWRAPIAFLFVDGLHDYWSVARDFQHFERHLSDESYVAFHDCDDSHPGVKTFVAGLAGSGCYEEVGRAASLVAFRKTGSPAHEAAGDDTTGWMAMSVRVNRQEKGIAFLMAELASRNRAIQEREKGIEWLQGVVRDKEATIAELEKGVAWLRKEVAERDLLIRALQKTAAADTDTSVFEPLSEHPSQNEAAREP
jgi:glycosyltransferase involved in cell wall biosynthesis